jgi:hypothetical protein
MIGFILCSISLAFLVQNQSGVLRYLESPVALGIGLAIMAISLLLGYLKKVPTIAWHDAFASSALLIWYAYWQPQFDEQAPMFFFFPLYFSLLTSIVTVALINRSDNFDLESIQHLRYLEKNTRFNIATVIVFVLLSLLITKHFALYPIAMSIFIIRHTITVCLETIDRG